MSPSWRSLAAQVAATVLRMPPALYGWPAILAANSAPRSPAKTRCACESTNPGSTARAAASTASSAAGASEERPVQATTPPSITTAAFCIGSAWDAFVISSPMLVISVLMRCSPWASCHAITQVRWAGWRAIMICMDDPVADAQALVAERFPAARAAFLGGGVLSARRTMTSDLDIVVVIDGSPAPYRESLRWRGWPVELFVHRVDGIGAWFAKDAAERLPTLARMCAGGVILADADGSGAAILAQAEAILAAGPPPLSPDEL